MPQQITQRLHFSLRTFGAAMLALYLAMAVDLAQPYWAMMTVYIVSQPLAAAVRSKALQRLLGTLVGASAAVAMLALLRNSPALLCLAMALWVGTCLALSVLDRTPGSYALMLAGYTAAIIGFGSVGQPGEIFTVALARSEEIMLGTVCAGLVHSLWFPRSVGDTLYDQIAAWLAEADRWAVDLLDGSAAATTHQDRMRLATAANELHQLASHLPYDTSRARETTAVVRALHDRMLLLIPLLASLGDRLAALRAAGPPLDADCREAIAQALQWIVSSDQGTPPDDQLTHLLSLANATDAGNEAGAHRAGMLIRLHDLLSNLDQARKLLACLHTGDAQHTTEVSALLRAVEARPMHRDPALALLSGAAAVIAVLIACAAWIGLGWAEGAASAMMAGILCCLFAATDDPAPSIKVFGTSLLLALPLAGIYRFLVFPAIDSFPMLVMSLAPTLVGIGVLMLSPGRALLSLVTLLNFCNALALQERTNADFAQFVNINLSQFFGVFVAIFVTRGLRSLSADASARRLLAQTWRQLALLAQGSNAVAPADYASRMIDRLTLLAPRLAGSPDPLLSGLDALDELRVGMDLVVIQGIRTALPEPVRTQFQQMLDEVAELYRRRQFHQPVDPSRLQPLLDRVLLNSTAAPQKRDPHVLAALLGLRSKLCPASPWPASGQAGSVTA